MKHPFPFRKVYGASIVLAAITMYGLLSALFGDGVWDEIACVALAIPLAVILWKYSRAPKAPSHRMERLDRG